MRRSASWTGEVELGSTSSGSTYLLTTTYREPVKPIGRVSDVDPLAIKVALVRVGAARGNPHVIAAEIVQTQWRVGASL